MGISSGRRLLACCWSSSTGSGRDGCGRQPPCLERGTVARAVLPSFRRSAVLEWRSPARTGSGRHLATEANTRPRQEPRVSSRRRASSMSTSTRLSASPCSPAFLVRERCAGDISRPWGRPGKGPDRAERRRRPPVTTSRSPADLPASACHHRAVLTRRRARHRLTPSARGHDSRRRARRSVPPLTHAAGRASLLSAPSALTTAATDLPTWREKAPTTRRRCVVGVEPWRANLRRVTWQI
jgi:hypothetical protein